MTFFPVPSPSHTVSPMPDWDLGDQSVTLSPGGYSRVTGRQTARQPTHCQVYMLYRERWGAGGCDRVSHRLSGKLDMTVFTKPLAVSLTIMNGHVCVELVTDNIVTYCNHFPVHRLI